MRASLASPERCKDILYMPSQLTQQVQRILASSPVPAATLAREAGVSETLLSLIRSGQRAVTADVALRLKTALRRISKRAEAVARNAARLADELETAGHQLEEG
jgi:hypothetical protein